MSDCQDRYIHATHPDEVECKICDQEVLMEIYADAMCEAEMEKDAEYRAASQ